MPTPLQRTHRTASVSRELPRSRRQPAAWEGQKRAQGRNPSSRNAQHRSQLPEVPGLLLTDTKLCRAPREKCMPRTVVLTQVSALRNAWKGKRAGARRATESALPITSFCIFISSICRTCLGRAYGREPTRQDFWL